MNKITNVMIAASLYGSQQMFKAQLDAYTHSRQVSPFLLLDKCSVGGDNCLRADIFVAAFNDFSFSSFVEFFKSLHDSNHNQQTSLQVFIKHDQEEMFSVYTQATIDQLLMKQ